jgi:hypothetical protein
MNAQYDETRQHASSNNTEEIKQHIDRTRSEIDYTIRAIEDCLSPQQNMNKAVDYFHRGPGEFSSNLERSGRDDPLLASLLTIGLGCG